MAAERKDHTQPDQKETADKLAARVRAELTTTEVELGLTGHKDLTGHKEESEEFRIYTILRAKEDAEYLAEFIQESALTKVELGLTGHKGESRNLLDISAPLPKKHKEADYTLDSDDEFLAQVDNPAHIPSLATIQALRQLHAKAAATQAESAENKAADGTANPPLTSIHSHVAAATTKIAAPEQKQSDEPEPAKQTSYALRFAYEHVNPDKFATPPNYPLMQKMLKHQNSLPDGEIYIADIYGNFYIGHENGTRTLLTPDYLRQFKKYGIADTEQKHHVSPNATTNDLLVSIHSPAQPARPDSAAASTEMVTIEVKDDVKEKEPSRRLSSSAPPEQRPEPYIEELDTKEAIQARIHTLNAQYSSTLRCLEAQRVLAYAGSCLGTTACSPLTYGLLGTAGMVTGGLALDNNLSAGSPTMDGILILTCAVGVVMFLASICCCARGVFILPVNCTEGVNDEIRHTNMEWKKKLDAEKGRERDGR